MPRAFILVLLFVAATYLAPAQLRSQQTTGSIRGKLLQTDNAKATIELFELTSGVRMLTASTDTASTFFFYDVPFGSYVARAIQGSDTVAIATLSVNSVVPLQLELSQTHSTVHGIDPHSYPALSHTFYPRAIIEKMPAPGEARRIESLFYNTPGVVPGESGRMHIRGEDAGPLTVIDGFPIATDLTRAHANLLNANLIRSADLLRGGLNAEYGAASAGVLALTSQTGIGKQFQARGYQTLGTFNLSEQGAVLGGGVSENVGYFLAYNRYSSDRYLEPVSGFEPNHSQGNLSTIFGKLDLILGKRFDVVILGTYNEGSYSIPNARIEKDTGQKQITSLLDYLFGARINWHVSEASVLSALGYTRSNTSQRLSGGLRNLEDSAQFARARQENERFFVGSDREEQAHGGLLEYSIRTNWGQNRHDIKIGVGGETIPLKQSLTLAVTDSLATVDGFGSSRFSSFDITRDGTPLVVDQSMDASRLSAYVQDEVQLSDEWSVGLGVRYDMFNLYEEESGISPRVQTVYRITEDVAVRASYDRHISQAPLENILLASSEQVNELGIASEVTPNYIGAQRSNAIELGALWSLDDNFDIDLSGYTKMIEDQHVTTELGSTGILLPISLSQSTVTGGELQLRVKNWNIITGQVAVSMATSRVGIPSSQTNIISGGPIIGEEAAYYHSSTSDVDLRTLQDQAFTASWIFNYDDGGGYYFTLGGRFDSGLPFPLAGSGSSAEAELQSRGISGETIELLDFSSSGRLKSVKPRLSLDLGAGLDLRRFIGIPIRVSAAALNVLNTKYLARFTPGFAGTHYGQPRTFVVTLEASY